MRCPEPLRNRIFAHMDTKIRVIVFEDNRDLREGMTYLLQATAGLEFAGAFPDCRELRELVPALQPDVVLMDIDMPGMTGIEATPLVKGLRPETQVLMLTVFEDEDKIFQAIRNGASGYLLKRTPPGEIIQAVFDVHRGGSPMTASIARKVLQYFQLPTHVTSYDYQLSPRELDILKGLVKGYSYKLIADELFISIDTVRSHIRHIYDKLQVNSKTEAVLKALREKIV